jgi:hypothetical protein
MKKKYEYIEPGENTLFSANRMRLIFEMTLIVPIFISLLFAFEFMEKFDHLSDSQENIIMGIMVICCLIAAFSVLYYANRGKSYFSFEKEHLEYNLSFQNQHLPIRIELNEIEEIVETKDRYVIKVNETELKINKNLLEVLNGFGILKEKLSSWNNKLV